MLRKALAIFARKWILRLACTLGLLSIAAVGCISVAKVDPAAADRQLISGELVPTETRWPKRDSPELPRITVEQGSGPVDCGAHKNCRVLRHIQTDELTSYLLVTKFSDSPLQVNGKNNFTSGEGKGASKFCIELENQTFVLALVQPATRQPAIGTMYYLASIEGMSKREQKLLKVACDTGWNVITTTVEMTFSYPQELRWGSEGEMYLAFRIDSHLADRAFAAESITAFLEKERPELMVRPRVMVGMSAGAIALPTVARRVDIDAAVLIGGGENVAEIMLTSPLFQKHTTLVEPVETASDTSEREYQPVSDVARRIEFAQRAFARCELDPSKMADSLNSIPVLMLHAQYDKIVPSRTGQRMYESLGKPERWMYRTGHVGLCVLMQQKINPVLDWLERQTATLTAARN